jgi:hypothetical protein
MKRTFNLYVQAAVVMMLLLLSLSVFATGKPPTATPGSAANASANASSNATANPTANAAGGLGGAASVNVTGYGGGYGGDNLYVLPAPISGSNLPAGMCQRSKYKHWAVIFNAISSAEGDSFTDLECLQLLMRLEDLKRQPIPVKPVAYVTADTIAPQRPTVGQQAAEAAKVAACEPPAKAKTVAAAKKAGACKS